MKKTFLFSILLVFTHLATHQKYDLTVVGSINFNSSIGRQSIGLIECLQDVVSMNVITTRDTIFEDLPETILPILQRPAGPSSVAIFEDLLIFGTERRYKKVPNSTIKLSYTMFETTQILPSWVDALNDHFDAAIVPDQFLVEVYKNSGVTIPIFVLPLGVYIEKFLAQPQKTQANKPFVFGCSTIFDPRKNHELLLKSFIEEFGNDKNVILKLHGRSGKKIYSELQTIIKKHGIKNVRLSLKNFSWHDYIDFMTSLDCYISLSKGEGFSITPREAMAFGIPCILSNNTAHTTICNSGLVLSVQSTIPEQARYPSLAKQPIGNYFTCNKKDVRSALRHMYNDYQEFLEKAKIGRIWVEQYLYKNLQQKYLTLVKPQKILLGNKNVIQDSVLITNSEALYQKYLSITNQKED